MKLIVSVFLFFHFPDFFYIYMLKPHKHTMVRSKFELAQDLPPAQFVPACQITASTDPILWYNTSP